MARKTKDQMVQEFFNFMNGKEIEELKQRLDKLMKEDKITAGARYFVYDPYEWYGFKKITDILDRAEKAKSYKQYITYNTTSFDWNYYLNRIQKDFERALAFVEEQEKLPFEKTQKQNLY